MTPHHADLDALTAYAIDALDAAERAALEAHLESCAECRRELSGLRRVTAGLMLSTQPEPPPEALKARTLARIAGVAQRPAALPRASTADAGGITPRPRVARWQGLAAAAGVMMAAALGIYALSLRSQLRDLRETVATLSARADSLRDRLRQAQQDYVTLTNTMHVLRAPDTVTIDLRGTAPATAGSSGRAFISPARGLVVDFDGLPALPAGRVYQLWLIPAGSSPVSAGVFGVSATGAASISAPLPPNATTPQVIAVTM